jgi:hypothetical protein
MSENIVRVYCAGAIRGELFNKGYFERVVQIVKELGAHPKTEKSGGYQVYPLEAYSNTDVQTTKDKVVARRDREWIRQSSAVIAEFSGASTGTGWEICYATRVQRKPTLCLYHEKSVPSLMIKQDDSDYAIVQMYRNEREFENYVSCFLEIVKRFRHPDSIRESYLKARGMIDSNATADDVRGLVESIAMRTPLDIREMQAKLKPDIESILILKPRRVEIDFKDAENFVQFLFRNLVLQKRWENLRSQEIGTTFASGRKPRIINVLSRQEQMPTSLLEIYNREGIDRIGYTREAFTKNVRAFRRIGLLEKPEKLEEIHSKTSMQFKDQLLLAKTFYGDITIVSSRSPREVMSSLIIVTQHLQHLSRFLEAFGPNSLVDFLNQSRHNGLLASMPDISIHNIDGIDTKSFLNEKWAQELAFALHAEGKRIWGGHFSTYKT